MHHGSCMVHREKWKEKTGFINTLRCRLTERILSLSCWMVQQRMENKPLSFWKGVFLLVLAKAEWETEIHRRKHTQHTTDLTALQRTPPTTILYYSEYICSSHNPILGSPFTLFHILHTPEQLTPGTWTSVPFPLTLFITSTIYFPIYFQNTVTCKHNNTAS